MRENQTFNCEISLEHRYKFLCDIPCKITGESYHGSGHDDDCSTFEVYTITALETVKLYDDSGENETDTILFKKGDDITALLQDDIMVQNEISEKFFENNVEMTKSPGNCDIEKYRRDY